MVAAAAGHQVKIPVVALLGVVVVMVPWVQLVGLRLRLCLLLVVVMVPWVQLVGLRLRRFSPPLLAAAARPCIRKLNAVFVFFAAGSQFEYRTAFVH